MQLLKMNSEHTKEIREHITRTISIGGIKTGVFSVEIPAPAQRALSQLVICTIRQLVTIEI